MDLYKVSRALWAVTASTADEPRCFRTIEEASEYMEHKGVNSDEIDVALIDMASQGTTRAHFGIDGTFISSDLSQLDMGSA